jgi:hypothetical protein
MDKNIIKKHLNSKFISEETVPGISVTAAVNKESGKFNKDGVKAIEKDVTAFEKNVRADKNEKEMAQNKFNYDDDFEKTYHDEMEIMNGQEMLQYDSKPDDNFKKRAEEAIEGSTRMGNNPEWANVIPKQQGFTGPDFGKNLVKRAKASSEKRNKQTPTLNLRGANIQADLKDTGHRPYALDENIETPEEKNARIISGWIAETGVDKVAEKLLNRYSETGMLSDMPDSMEYGNAINKIISLLNKKEFTLAMQTAKKSAAKLDKKAMKGGMFENNDNNKIQIKEGMKRLKFKKEFNGVGNALKMIPEGYRVDNKEFEMTDGNETYKIRWEGNLTEGRAVVLMASDKKMVSEDMAHMKHLMGYKSTETLGLLKGKSRINENAVFGDIYNKSKMLLEGEDIENAKAKTGEWDGITKKAPESTKHVQGSVSKDKGTQAPSAKEGDLDDAVSHAPEAKKHVEGSVSTEKGTKAPAPKKGEWEAVKKKASEATKHVTMKESFQAEEEEEEEGAEEVKTKEVKTEGENIEGKKVKAGHWEDISIPHAAEAKKHIHMGKESTAKVETEAKEEVTESVVLGGIKFEPITEGMYEEGMYETEGFDEEGFGDDYENSDENFINRDFLMNKMGELENTLSHIATQFIVGFDESMVPMSVKTRLLETIKGSIKNAIENAY